MLPFSFLIIVTLIFKCVPLSLQYRNRLTIPNFFRFKNNLETRKVEREWDTFVPIYFKLGASRSLVVCLEYDFVNKIPVKQLIR